MNVWLCVIFNGKWFIVYFEGILCWYVLEQDCFRYCLVKGKGILIGVDGWFIDFYFFCYFIGDGGVGVYEVYMCGFLLGDKLLFYLDGLIDQFGGFCYKKFFKCWLKELFVMFSGILVSELSVLIFREYKDWKNGWEQIDDVLFLLIFF